MDLETRFKDKNIELQRFWRNSIGADDFNNVPTLSDDELEAGIQDAVTQLRFEKWLLRPLGLALNIVFFLVPLYALVRFVKWAWGN